MGVDNGECHRNKWMNWLSLLDNTERTEKLIEFAFDGACAPTLPTPPPCPPDVCGTEADGQCRLVEAPGGGDSYVEAQFHSRGTVSEFHTCTDEPDTGLPMTCVPVHFAGVSGGDVPICRVCDPTNLEPGCPCDPQAGDCASGIECHPSGTCNTTGPTFEGLPSWECEVDCEELYGAEDGYCFHGEPWAEAVQDTVLVTGVPGGSPYQPICASLDCGSKGSTCAIQLKGCVEEACEAECYFDQNNGSCSQESVSPLHFNFEKAYHQTQSTAAVEAVLT